MKKWSPHRANLFRLRPRPKREEDQIIQAAADELREMVPADWQRRNVVPPWADQDAGCRSCGGSAATVIALLAHKLHEERVLLFTFAMVCQGCFNNEMAMTALSDRAFGKPKLLQ